MSTAAETQPSMPLRFARHIVGMMILALASPYVWYGSQGALTWASTWITPLVIAGVAFGLYALFFTKRAKAAWPGRFFMLAWVLLALVVAAPYLETFNQKRAAQQVPVQQEQPATEPAAQAAQPNFFDQFDHPAPRSREAYAARVKALRSAGEAGDLLIVEVRQPSREDNSLGRWSTLDVGRVEAEQTWWIANGIVWLHVANHSKFNMNVIQFEYAPGLCGNAAPESYASYNLPLKQAITPGTEALIRFAAGDVVHGGDGCLNVTGILG
ncbi:hypothetical protein [Alicycliphilus denitrificans]|uniref:hypothetical protein n=1 Tax=Alicycliphilus denitrificans TaxID=179636 RepID=UPI0001DA01FC|nr:hypothetical protein [Alicycliphilus denitrificans]ADU99440.1 hypothetical protein Alide_1685 [Alicycliphilus denitrificans BC]